MKKSTVLVLAVCLLCLLLALSACGKTSEPAANDADYRMDLNAWQGVYSDADADRGTLFLLATGNETASVSIDWSNSAAVVDHWEMSGKYNADTQSLVYTDAVVTETTYGTDGTSSSRVVYSNGTGSIKLTNGQLIWTDDVGVAGEPSTFGFDMSMEEYIRRQQAAAQIQVPVNNPVENPNPEQQPVATQPTPEPTPAANAKDLPIIRKSPTDETVKVGGSAVFVAKYDNALWAVWHFVSPDGMIDLDYEQAAERFPTLEIVNGMYSRMTLNKIPLELNGWRVYCRYSNPKGYTDTQSALITVNDPAAVATPAPSPTAIPIPIP